MIELVNFLDTSYEKQFSTLAWRNSKQVADYFQIKYIDEETHRNWLEKLQPPDFEVIAFFIRVDGVDVGVTYFHSIDHEMKQADWGMYIHDKNMRGKGIGQQALSQCLGYAHDEMRMHKIFLEVIEGNHAAIRLYEKLGFALLGQKDDVIRMEKALTPATRS